MKAQDLILIAKQSFQEWTEDRAPNEAAALAYYTLLSVPAMLLLIQWILGRVVGEQVQQQVIDFVQQSVRGGGGEAIAAMIESADSLGSGGGITTAVSLAVLAVSATGALTHFEQTLNRIWEIVEMDVGLVSTVRERLTSLLLVVVLGAFLLVSATLSTIVSGFTETLSGNLPVGEWAVHLVNISLSLILLTLLFGATLKVIPDAVIAWRDVWLGAAVTAVLFVVGQYILSLYLGMSAPGSAYGAAGSVVALVVWIYYSALILFLGAEFTQVYANRFGSRIQPDDSATTLEEKVLGERPRPGRESAADYDLRAASTAGQGRRQQTYVASAWQRLGAVREFYRGRPTQMVEAENGQQSSFRLLMVAVVAGVVAIAYWWWERTGDVA